MWHTALVVAFACGIPLTVTLALLFYALLTAASSGDDNDGTSDEGQG
jgi:hypothetical protein